MRKFYYTLAALICFVCTADAQLFRRVRSTPVGQAPMPTEVKKVTPAPAQPNVSVAVDTQTYSGRPGGKIRDFIKRLLGR